LKTNKTIKTIKAHDHSVDSIELASFDKIISGSFDESIKIWDRQTFTLIKTLEGLKESFICLKLLSNDRLLSCSTKKDSDVNPIKIWDLKTGECLKSFGGQSGAFCSIDYISALNI
jgi:WD40 repeat protein